MEKKIILMKIKELEEDICGKLNFAPYIIKKIINNINDINISDECVKQKLQRGEKTLLNHTREKGVFYIICANGIGDTIITASYCNYLKETKKFKKTKLLLLEHQAYIGELYNYLDGSEIVTKDEMNDIVYYIQRTKQYRTKNYFYSFFEEDFSKKGYTNYYSIKWDRKKFLSERYKETLFKIPIDTKPNKINLVRDKKLLHQIISKNKLTKKSIIIMPVSHSEIKLDNIFWEDLASKLIKNGYKVYTNVGKNELPIKGTLALDINLKELIYIANEVKYFISMRSGICEYLALTSPNLIVLNNTQKNNNMWDDVNTFDPKKGIINMYTRGKTNDELINKIIFNINGGKK